jgi:hypothetical protein
MASCFPFQCRYVRLVVEKMKQLERVLSSKKVNETYCASLLEDYVVCCQAAEILYMFLPIN